MDKSTGFATPAALVCLLFFATSLWSQKIVVDSIVIQGNKKTKAKIILRELQFTKGDTLELSTSEKIIARSESNLLNTALFNFATITMVPGSPGHVLALVKVTERWYLWPLPVFEIAETNFNTWWLSKDFTRLNYGFYLAQENFRGRHEILRFLIQHGYTREYAMQYQRPWLNKRKTLGISITGGYNRNHEVNYATADNKRIFYKNTDSPVSEDYFFRLALNTRPGIKLTQSLLLNYDKVLVSDTLIRLSSDYLGQEKNELQWLTLGYIFRYDTRDIVNYPLKGYVLYFEIRKNGFDLLRGEDLNTGVVYALYNHHYRLGNSRFYGAYSFKIKSKIFEDPPYRLQEGLGYHDYVRGYEYYVLDGQSYGLFRSNLKYELVRPHTGNISWLPSEKFSKYHYALYLNLFYDAGMVKDHLYQNLNPLNNTYICGFGAGLDFVTYYDMVLRLEYSFNKMMEHGLYINYVKPF